MEWLHTICEFYDEMTLLHKLLLPTAICTFIYGIRGSWLERNTYKTSNDNWLDKYKY